MKQINKYKVKFNDINEIRFIYGTSYQEAKHLNLKHRKDIKKISFVEKVKESLK